MRLVLASASPRRAALLRAAGYAFEVRPSGAVEPAHTGGDPAAYAEALARAKAAGADDGDEVFVGADTIVVLDGAVLGKPAGPSDAAAMLRRLSGRTHQVITAVAVRHGSATRSAHASAAVSFRPLSEREIADYVATGEPLDKAGAYAYQGGARAFITRLEGEPDTVIGLPVALLDELLPPELRR
ncbi:MAG TPA: Maf family protein [Candidatus Dormibacteraeota bacterium]